MSTIEPFVEDEVDAVFEKKSDVDLSAPETEIKEPHFDMETVEDLSLKTPFSEDEQRKMLEKLMGLRGTNAMKYIQELGKMHNYDNDIAHVSGTARERMKLALEQKRNARLPAQSRAYVEKKREEQTKKKEEQPKKEEGVAKDEKKDDGDFVEMVKPDSPDGSEKSNKSSKNKHRKHRKH